MDILFVGAKDRMEMDKVPAAGYPIVGLPVKGFDRAHLLNNIQVVNCLLKSLWLAKKTGASNETSWSQEKAPCSSRCKHLPTSFDTG